MERFQILPEEGSFWSIKPINDGYFVYNQKHIHITEIHGQQLGDKKESKDLRVFSRR